MAKSKSNFFQMRQTNLRHLVERGSALLDSTRWGDCPLCGKKVIKGRTAYGCSDFKNGCPFLINMEYKGLKLSTNQIRVLLQLHIMPYAVHIEEQPRLLLLGKHGFVMDIDLPSANQAEEGRIQRPPRQEADPKKAEVAARRGTTDNHGFGA